MVVVLVPVRGVGLACAELLGADLDILLQLDYPVSLWQVLEDLRLQLLELLLLHVDRKPCYVAFVVADFVVVAVQRTSRQRKRSHEHNYVVQRVQYMLDHQSFVVDMMD
jgi:hypothetical protein